jgi:dephospho-CoA kinase
MTKFIIGLTGQVGSGKTFAANQLCNHIDFEYIDLDKIGHDLLTKKDVISKLCNVFGHQILDMNKINRKTLGDIVFNDHLKLDQLNLIVHPLIKKETQLKINATTKSTILIVGALLEEINLISICHKIITITASEKDQFKYLGKKKKIVKHQKKIKFYEKMADFVVLNDFKKEFIDKFIILVQTLIQENLNL